MKSKTLSYTDRVHRYGRLWFFASYFFIYLFPVATSIYFHAWPTWQQLFTAAVGVIPVYWTATTVEVFTYVPMLGAGGSYLGFITGNIVNAKMPAAINAMESLGVSPGTEEGEVISTIAIAVSSIVTTVVIGLFAVLLVPLTPLFTNPTLAPAFENVVPALFGALTVVFVSKNKKIGVPPLVLCALLFTLFPALSEIYPLLVPVIAGLTALRALILYRRHILPGGD